MLVIALNNEFSWGLDMLLFAAVCALSSITFFILSKIKVFSFWLKDDTYFSSTDVFGSADNNSVERRFVVIKLNWFFSVSWILMYSVVVLDFFSADAISSFNYAFIEFSLSTDSK